jgi:hypothetical protein
MMTGTSTKNAATACEKASLKSSFRVMTRVIKGKALF